MTLKKSVLFLVCGIFTLLSYGTTTAYGEENNQVSETSIVLHKLIVQEGQSTHIANAGEELTPEQLPSTIGLNGVEFTLYDLTPQLSSKLAAGISIDQAQEELIKEQKGFDLSKLVQVGKATTQTQRGEDGIAVFHLETTEVPSGYLLVESKTPAAVQTEADNTVLICPSYDSAGQPLSEIHVYPKSVIKTPPVTTETTSQTSSQPPVSSSVSSVDETKEFSKSELPKTNEQLQSGLTVAGMIILLFSVGIILKQRGKMNNNK